MTSALDGKRVLFDAEHALSPRGTGLATYARNVVAGAVALGGKPEALVDVDFRPSRHDADTNLGRLRAGGGPEAMSRLLPMSIRRAIAPDTRKQDGFRRYASGLLARPFGARVGPLPWIGQEGGEGATMLPFERAHAVCELRFGARQHAIRWGRSLPLWMDPAARPDLVHVTQVLPIRLPGRPTVVTIHDIIPVLVPGMLRSNAGHERMVVEAILRTADRVLTVSDHTRDALIRHCGGDPDRIVTTFQTHGVAAADIAAADAVMDECLRFHGLERDGYFVFCGAIEPKKNVPRLIEAYAGSGTRRPLVLIGGLGWSHDDAVAAIGSDRFIRLRPDGDGFRQERMVRRLPYLPRPMMLALVRGARALVMPSLHEGFGLPAIEAMALGTPVIASRTTGLGEVTRGAAEPVDPLDVMDIARAIRALDADNSLCAGLKSAGRKRADDFSAERHLKRLADAYAGVL
jgi:glycosyltransferase involved in cell wall biosynthesis